MRRGQLLAGLIGQERVRLHDMSLWGCKDVIGWEDTHVATRSSCSEREAS